MTKTYMCDLCDYSSKFRQNVTRHCKTIHLETAHCKIDSDLKTILEEQKTVLECPKTILECPKTILDTIDDSNKIMQYKCEFCGYISKYKASMKRHYKSLHLEDYVCNEDKKRNDIIVDDIHTTILKEDEPEETVPEVSFNDNDDIYYVKGSTIDSFQDMLIIYYGAKNANKSIIKIDDDIIRNKIELLEYYCNKFKPNAEEMFENLIIIGKIYKMMHDTNPSSIDKEDQIKFTNKFREAYYKFTDIDIFEKYM